MHSPKFCAKNCISADVMTFSLFWSSSIFQNQTKSSLYSQYYAKACNEWRGPSPQNSAWATELRRNMAAVASRWRLCADLTRPGIKLQTSRTDSVRLATGRMGVEELVGDAKGVPVSENVKNHPLG